MNVHDDFLNKFLSYAKLLYFAVSKLTHAFYLLCSDVVCNCWACMAGKSSRLTETKIVKSLFAAEPNRLPTDPTGVEAFAVDRLRDFISTLASISRKFKKESDEFFKKLLLPI